MAEYKLVVLTNAVAGRDAEFNAWYDDPHLGDVLSVQGFTRAQRFALDPEQVTDQPMSHAYLAIYDFESEDVAASLRRFLDVCAAKMQISPDLAPDALPMVFRVLGPPQLAG